MKQFDTFIYLQRLTVHFLRRKLAEYESLKKQIARLRREVDRLPNLWAKPQ